MAFKPRREARKNRLIRAGFLPFEAQALSEIKDMTLPYVKDAVKERREIVKKLAKEGEALGWSNTRFEKELRSLVNWLYKDKGWLVRDTAITRAKSVGRPDPWLMIQEYRERAIERGDYTFTGWKRREDKKRYRELHPEKIAAQKRRYRERQRLQGTDES